MDTRKIAAEYRLAHWTQIIRDQKESRLCISKYCESAGIHKNTYYYWLRKLREATCSELQEVQQNSSIDSAQSIIPVGWAVCETQNKEEVIFSAETETNSVVVDIGHCSVRVTTNTDQNLLSQVCRMLVALC